MLVNNDNHRKIRAIKINNRKIIGCFASKEASLDMGSSRPTFEEILALKMGEETPEFIPLTQAEDDFMRTQIPEFEDLADIVAGVLKGTQKTRRRIGPIVPYGERGTICNDITRE